MKKIRLDEVEQAALSGAADRRDVSTALGTTDVALMYYELEPGQRLSGGYHTHLDQEELFYVLDGEAEFKTEDGKRTVGAGEVIRFAPGEFQTGYNHYDNERVLRVLAVGAPPGMDETVSIFECPNCGERAEHDVHLDEEGGTGATTCRACGFEMTFDTDSVAEAGG